MKKILLLLFLLCGSAYPATATYTVATSGGDFTSIGSFFERDTTISAGDTVVCSLLIAGLDSITTTQYNFNGWSPDSSSYIRLIASDTVRHRGVIDPDNAYMIAFNANTGFTHSFQTMTPAFGGCHVEWEGIQFRNNASGSQIFAVTQIAGAMRIKATDCLFTLATRVGTWTTNISDMIATFNNCGFIDLGTEAFDARDGQATTIFNNCTFAGSSQAITGDNASLTMKNCIVANMTNAADSALRLRSSGTYDISYTVSEDGSADDNGGTGNKASRTILFRDTTNAVYLLDVNDTACQGAGTDLTSTIPNDIQGEARSTNQDIGFDEVYYTSLTIDTADMFTALIQTGPNATVEQDYNGGGLNQARAGKNNVFLDVYTSYELFQIEDLYADISGITSYDVDSIYMSLNVVLQKGTGTEYYIFQEVDTTLLIIEGTQPNFDADADSCEPSWVNYHTAGGGTCVNDAWTTGGGDVIATRIDSFYVNDTTGLYEYGWGYGSGLVTYYQDIVAGNTVVDTVFDGKNAMASLLRIAESTGANDTRAVWDVENGTTPPVIKFFYYGGVDNTPVPSTGGNRKIVIGAF